MLVGHEQFQAFYHKPRERLGECVAKGRGVLGLPVQLESFVESLRAFRSVGSTTFAL